MTIPTRQAGSYNKNIERMEVIMSSPLPAEPVECPQAWLGEDLANSSSWIRHFSAEEIDELETAARDAAARGKALDELQRTDFHLPILQAAAGDWLRELDIGRGFILLRGLPVERWGLELSQYAYVALGLQMGSLSSQNAAGDLLGHIRDIGADPNDPAVRLYKTNKAQGFHTDGADVIGLLCLRTAKQGGESRIVSSVSVFNHILSTRPDLAHLMFEAFHFDRQEERSEGEDPTFELPLTFYDGEKLRMFYLGWNIRIAQRHPHVPRLSQAQTELLDLIDATADQLALDMNFQPGDIQLLKNSTMLHGRSAFVDWEEQDRKRHLLRIWINADIAMTDQGNIVKAVTEKAGGTSDAELLAADRAKGK